jgi:hypothetical protein
VDIENFVAVSLTTEVPKVKGVLGMLGRRLSPVCYVSSDLS